MDEVLQRMLGKLSIVNKGINGNRLLSGPPMAALGLYGSAGMERFERDVLGEAGASAVIIEMGTNDIGMSHNPQKPGWITAGKLEKAFEEVVQRCHDRKIKVYGSTILPRGGSPGYLKEAEAERRDFNEWMRGSSLFDGVLDFDVLLRDSSCPEILSFPYDSGDHLHPHPLGGRQMAALVAERILSSM